MSTALRPYALFLAQSWYVVLFSCLPVPHLNAVWRKLPMMLSDVDPILLSRSPVCSQERAAPLYLQRAIRAYHPEGHLSAGHVEKR
jgi:hypothetical protein